MNRRGFLKLFSMAVAAIAAKPELALQPPLRPFIRYDLLQEQIAYQYMFVAKTMHKQNLRFRIIEPGELL